MKKAFTLMELVVSISLFFIIIIFLYKALNMTKKSNVFFEKKVTQIVNDNKLKKILIEDIIESSKVEFFLDKDSNTILQLETSNMYHNVFFTHVTYLISKKKNLIRLESLKKFDKLKLSEEFFKNTYIDVLDVEVEKFDVTQLKDNEKAFSIIIKKENNEEKIYGTLRI